MNRMGERYVFIIVGVGGTGSLLARDLPKLLINTDHKMLLVDGDRVERKNMKRQSYQEQDIGEYKSIALSAKINTFYDTRCEAIGLYLTKNEILEYCNNNYLYTPVLDESCEVQASKGNVQFLVTNNKMANYLLEHCNALLMRQLKGGVQRVERFGSVFYPD